MIKNLIIGGIGVVALIVGITAYNKTPERLVGSTGPQGPRGEQGIQGEEGPAGRDGRDGVTRVVTEPSKPVLGAVSSPDIMSPYFSYGGNRHWAYSTVAKGTESISNGFGSTTCQILSPSATTTLVSASAYFTSIGSTSPVEIGMTVSATSTRGQVGVQYTGETGIRTNATTTLITASAQNVAASGGQVIASSTAETLIVPPYSYINTKIGGGSAATPNTVVGVCKASFIDITNF